MSTRLQEASADLLVVIVNYRTPDLTIQCLESLIPQAADVPGMRVVVTDNASGDDSVPRIQAAIAARGMAPWCRVVPLPRNGGFAYGNNRGIEAGSRARYVLLLNSDTIVHGHCLRRCLDVMDAGPDIGALSCRLLNADGSIQNAARRFPSPVRLTARALGLPDKLPRLFAWANLDHPGWDRSTQSRDVEWLGGAFLMLRADVLATIGLLDEGFFFYGEDIEINHRIMRAGYRRRYECQETTTHLGGASSDPARMSKLARNEHHWRARYLVQRLCYGPFAQRWVRFLDVATHMARRTWHGLRAGQGSAQYQYHRDIIRTIRGLESGA